MAIPGIEDNIERFKSFDGTEIATAAWGDKNAPTVILSNGICCTDTYWTYLQPLLVEAGYRVIFFDYRGHNRSGRPGNPNEIGLPAHARDLWAAADHYGVEEAVLIGHSMGCQTIFEAYRQHPERVKGLVPLAGPFEYPLDNIYMTPVGAMLLAGLGLTLRRAPTPVRLVWEFMGRDNRFALNASRLLGVIGKHADKDLEGEYFDHLASLDPLLLVKLFEGMQIHSARDVLPNVDVPVLQVAGSRDMLTPMPLQREMASLLPNVQLEVLHGVTHTLPIDEPEVVNSLVLDYLKEIYGSVSPEIPEQASEQESSSLKSVS